MDRGGRALGAKRDTRGESPGGVAPAYSPSGGGAERGSRRPSSRGEMRHARFQRALASERPAVVCLGEAGVLLGEAGERVSERPMSM